jgi:hypothetical protein
MQAEGGLASKEALVSSSAVFKRILRKEVARPSRSKSLEPPAEPQTPADHSVMQ